MVLCRSHPRQWSGTTYFMSLLQHKGSPQSIVALRLAIRETEGFIL